MGRRPETSLDVARMVKLYGAGLTVERVAATLEVDPLTVSKYLHAAGVEIRRRGPRNEITDEQILELLTDGRTVAEVAEIVGMSRRGVYTRLRRHQPSRQLYERLPRQSDARKINRSRPIAARRQAADQRFPANVRQQLLDLLATGVLLREALKVVPVTSTTLWERTRWDPVWAEQLVTTLDANRPTGWSHGHARTYDRGCRCAECRATRAYQGFTELVDPDGPPGLIKVDPIIQLRAEGLTGREIGERLGMPTATVHSRLRRFRLTGRPARGPRTRLDVDRMVELYRSGLTLTQVGEQMGVLGSTVSKRLRKAGVDRRHRGPDRSPVTNQQLLALRAQGLTGPQIAERVGMTKNGVYTRLRKIRLADRTDYQDTAQAATDRVG